MNNPISSLTNLGQSLWYDNIQRRLIENGELDKLIKSGEIRGITSNPSIFHNAITKTADYDPFLLSLAWSGEDAESIFWSLAIQDVRDAADKLKDLYNTSGKHDGYVSLEVNPIYANNTEKTIAQAKDLWTRVDRPNLMIKIPATLEGIPAIRHVIAAGINVNATLIFSLERYAQVMDAYMDGLELRVAAGKPIDHIASVASFFISRLDTKVDARLSDFGAMSPDMAIRVAGMKGKASIANAKLAYAAFQTTFTSERFSRLRNTHGATIQRPLWASTSTKNPEYPDTLYVDQLIGPDTVNTVPPQTLDAFKDHGVAEVTLTRNVPQARQNISDLDELGISIAEVTKELEVEGIAAFANAFTDLLKSIEEKRKRGVSQLGQYQLAVERRIARLDLDKTVERIFEHDPSLWTLDTTGQSEIRVRLGWLDAVSNYKPMIGEITAFKDEIIAAGFKNVLLLGMGGSSLAPEVVNDVFTNSIKGKLNFSIVDSTDPDQVAEAVTKNPPAETVFIVSSKSGGTAEVNALFNYFWEISGKDGSRFIAITDPVTALESQAKELGFRRIFHGDPTVGGRFSALTPFGLVPTALIGIDLDKLLAAAESMVQKCSLNIPGRMNPGMALGAIIGQMALDGRDKLTFVTDPPFGPFGAWLEQLIAESSGKNGRGIVVVDGEQPRDPNAYGPDRLFVYLHSSGLHDEFISQLIEHGHPAIMLDVKTPYDLGAEFFRWEYATAVACSILGVNAFDQPDVQLSKDITKKKINHYLITRTLDEGVPAWDDTNNHVFGSTLFEGDDLCQVLLEFLSSAEKYDYVGINAFLPRSEKVVELTQSFREKIGLVTGCATTLGFGPRFLHSTGQLQKGGENNGLFIQLTVKPESDMEIPTMGMTFGVLERAQALGDYDALLSRHRRVIRIHLPNLGELNQLTKQLG